MLTALQQHHHIARLGSGYQRSHDVAMPTYLPHVDFQEVEQVELFQIRRVDCGEAQPVTNQTLIITQLCHRVRML